MATKITISILTWLGIAFFNGWKTALGIFLTLVISNVLGELLSDN